MGKRGETGRSLGGGGGPGLSSAPLGLHTWEQKLILFGTAAWPHSQAGLGGGFTFSQGCSLYVQGPSRRQQKW